MGPHAAIIKLGKELGYVTGTKEDDGLCRGFSSSWLKAGLVGDEKRFNERVNTIMNEEDLPSKIDAAREKVKNKESLTESEKNLLEIPAFYESVMLHQSPENYSDVFNKTYNQGDTAAVAEMVSFEKLDDLGGLKKAYSETNSYTPDELKNHLKDISKELDKINETESSKAPVGFLLSSSNHTIALSYNASNKEWTCNDSNQDPLKTADPDEVANYVTSSLGFEVTNGRSTFHTDAFTTAKDKRSVAIAEALDGLKETHTMSKEKAQTVVGNDKTLSHMAAQYGDANTTNKIANVLGPEFNRPDANGNTPAHIAASQGQSEVIRAMAKLPNAETMFNTPNKFGYKPAHLAAILGKDNVVSELKNAPNANKLLNIQEPVADKSPQEIRQRLSAEASQIFASNIEKVEKAREKVLSALNDVMDVSKNVRQTERDEFKQTQTDAINRSQNLGELTQIQQSLNRHKNSVNEVNKIISEFKEQAGAFTIGMNQKAENIQGAFDRVPMNQRDKILDGQTSETAVLRGAMAAHRNPLNLGGKSANTLNKFEERLNAAVASDALSATTNRAQVSQPSVEAQLENQPMIDNHPLPVAMSATPNSAAPEQLQDSPVNEKAIDDASSKVPTPEPSEQAGAEESADVPSDESNAQFSEAPEPEPGESVEPEQPSEDSDRAHVKMDAAPDSASGNEYQFPDTPNHVPLDLPDVPDEELGQSSESSSKNREQERDDPVPS